MLTFTQLYTETYQGCGLPTNPGTGVLTDSVQLNLIKRNINNGNKLMKVEAGVYTDRKEVTASLTQGQQYYTFDPDVIRVRNLRVNNGSLIFPIRPVESENEWNALNIIPSFAVFYPQRYFIRGNNEIGIWPMPAVNIANALVVAYDSRQQDMYLDDVTGISVTVTNASTTITTTGTGSNKFAANMVGMMLTFTDGSDGNWYKIVGFTSITQMTLENFYPGATQTSTGTLIGLVPDIDEPYQINLEDYAYYRYFKGQRGSAEKANDFLNDFRVAQIAYRGNFGDKESSQILLPNSSSLPYDPLRVPPVNMNGSGY